MSEPELTVYFDFLCPWAYRGALWLLDVQRAGRAQPRFQFFSLSENHRAREGLGPEPVWQQDGTSKGLPAFKAAIAARAQGEQAYDRFRVALQKARHEERMPVDDPKTHRYAAGRAAIEVGRFERDLKDVDYAELVREHTEAVRKGVFGVPTLVWPEGRSYYLKITDLIPTDKAVALYDAIEMVHRFGEVVEIKTPESEGTLPL